MSVFCGKHVVEVDVAMADRRTGGDVDSYSELLDLRHDRLCLFFAKGRSCADTLQDTWQPPSDVVTPRRELGRRPIEPRTETRRRRNAVEQAEGAGKVTEEGRRCRNITQNAFGRETF